MTLNSVAMSNIHADWIRFCYVMRLENIQRLFWIFSVFTNFHSGERIQKVADLHAGFAGFTGYVLTEDESAKKELRIQIYRDTCESTGPCFCLHMKCSRET